MDSCRGALRLQGALLECRGLRFEYLGAVLQLSGPRLGGRSLHRHRAGPLLGVGKELTLVIDGDRRLLAKAYAGQDPGHLSRVERGHALLSRGQLQRAPEQGGEHAEGRAIGAHDGDDVQPPNTGGTYERLWRERGFDFGVADGNRRSQRLDPRMRAHWQAIQEARMLGRESRRS